MFLKNNKGFTVIELIMSFLFASILSLSLFSAVLVYRQKQNDSTIESDLLAFKSQLIIDVENDIQLKGVKDIEVDPEKCPVYDSDGNLVKDGNGNPVLNSRCVLITFNDDTSKIFKIASESKQDIIDSGASSESFDYDVLYIVYGDIRYDIPDSGNVYIEDDYILSKTIETDGIEGNIRLYRINFNLKHNNLDNDIDISIVASGTKAINTPGTYRSYNIGNDVVVQVNKNEQLNFKVIEKSSEFMDTVTLLYNGNYDDSLVFNRINYNNLENLGSRYKNSSIKNKVNDVAASWNNADSVRLITVEEIAGLSSFCPQYRGADSPDVSLAASYDWLLNQNYWTMSEKLSSGNNNGKMVWVVDGTNKLLKGDLVNSSYALRPVIEVKKDYITN